jgi:hypothetical protein
MMLSARNSFAMVCMVVAGLFAYQAPQDYFHGAAQTYVLSGDAKQAKAIIGEGLVKFPNNASLLKLRNKIKEDEKKQDPKNQNDQNNQSKDSTQNQANKDQNKQDQQQKKDQDKQDQKDKQDKKDQKQTQQQPDKQEQMKKQEAERLIRQFSDDANNLNKPAKIYKPMEKKPEKDW